MSGREQWVVLLVTAVSSDSGGKDLRIAVPFAAKFLVKIGDFPNFEEGPGISPPEIERTNTLGSK